MLNVIISLIYGWKKEMNVKEEMKLKKENKELFDKLITDMYMPFIALALVELIFIELKEKNGCHTQK